MEILSENVEEEKDKDKDKEKEKEKEKSDKPSKVTVHNVYIKAKDKKSTDRTAEAKELIKQELNLKLSVCSRISTLRQHTALTIYMQDKPELLKTSLEQLASSFSRADWVAEGNKSTM